MRIALALALSHAHARARALAALIVAGFATTATSAVITTTAAPLAYPATARIDQSDNYFGTVVQDPYRWLEDDNSAQTKDWVAQQNALTFGWLQQIPFRDAVLARLRTISNYAKYSAPFKKNGKVYFYKNDGLQNQSVLFVQNSPEAAPELLLDPNRFSPDGTVRLQSFTLSRDGRYAAYGRTAIPGSDWQDIQVMDMATRQPLPEVLHWVKFYGPAWRGDGFYYSRYPEPAKGTELTAAAQNQKVYFHRVGTPQSADTLVYEDTAHPDYFVGINTTDDERFAALTVNDRSKRGNSLFVRDDGRGETGFRPLVADITEDSFSVVDNDGDDLLVLTTRRAPNRMLQRVDPVKGDWTTVLPEQKESLEHVSMAGGRIFATYLHDVSSRVQVHELDGRLRGRIALPAPGTAEGFEGAPGDTDVFYTFSAMNLPPTLYRYDIAQARSEVFRAPAIAGFDAARFESRQVFYKSRDGTRVPMFIVHKKGLKRDGRNPTILYGYGGFNVTMNPWFSAARIAWMEQGGVFALANLRGGGEYGEAWHEAGMRLKKQNVFDDCIGAAEYLIRTKITSPDRLALQGGSNGGLLVGAVINQRPALFKVALPQVGVMDMLRFQKFSVGAAWVSDYGSSDDPEQFRNLLRYSPLHNLRAGVAYPATLITTSDHDDRVVPAHSFKYAATLQALSAGAAPHLIRIETNSGHGASNLTKSLAEAADTYSFIWAVMGIEPKFAH